MSWASGSPDGNPAWEFVFVRVSPVERTVERWSAPIRRDLPDTDREFGMYTCDTCGEEFPTLSRLRLDHDPCPVAERQRRGEEAVRRLREEWRLEVGDWCRVIGTGEEVEIVEVEPGEGDDDDPVVVWVPAGSPDAPEHRHTTPAGELV